MSTEKDTRTHLYDQANDKTSFMTDLQKCLDKLEKNGYIDQFKVENKRLVSLKEGKDKYKPKEVKL